MQLMQGKTCLVTGASAGIGRATALGLAQLGATVVLASRSARRAAEARDAVAHESGNSDVHALAADLSSQASVRRLATEFLDRHGRLDVLINNAAVIRPERSLTVTAWRRPSRSITWRPSCSPTCSWTP